MSLYCLEEYLEAKLSRWGLWFQPPVAQDFSHRPLTLGERDSINSKAEQEIQEEVLMMLRTA